MHERTCEILQQVLDMNNHVYRTLFRYRNVHVHVYMYTCSNCWSCPKLTSGVNSYELVNAYTVLIAMLPPLLTLVGEGVQSSNDPELLSDPVRAVDRRGEGDETLPGQVTHLGGGEGEIKIAWVPVLLINNKKYSTCK